MGIELCKGVSEYSLKKNGEDFFYINDKKTNFRVKEFKCNDGSDQILIDDELVEKLQVIRSYYGRAVIINSGYRTPAYNKKIGGATNSQHCLGKACDIHLNGIKPTELFEFAKKIGFTGVGLYSWGVHVDTRPNKSYWKG